MKRTFHAEEWPLKQFKTNQQNEIDIKRDLHHIFIGLHFQSGRGQNFSVLAFPFFILPGELGGKHMVWFIRRQPVQHKQIKIPYIHFYLEQIAIILMVFPLSTLSFQ